jgi:hypothetical protein
MPLLFLLQIVSEKGLVSRRRGPADHQPTQSTQHDIRSAFLIQTAQMVPRPHEDVHIDEQQEPSVPWPPLEAGY